MLDAPVVGDAASRVRLAIATLFVGAVCTIPTPAGGWLPTNDIADPMPPPSCQSAACLQGAHAFARGNYAEAASALEQGVGSPEGPRIDLESYADMSLLAALSRRRTGALLKSAAHFERLARLRHEARSFYAFQALKSALQADQASSQLLQQLHRLGALATRYPGHPFVALKYHLAVDGRLDSPSAVATALREGETESVCRWLAGLSDEDWPTDRQKRRQIRSAAYAHCLEVPETTTREDFYAAEPAPEARLTRAEHLYGRVEYQATLAELEKLEFDSLAPPDRCRARFRRGRALYRLDRYASAADVYRRVVDRCDTDASVDPRIRSLYALGRRQFHLDHLSRSRSRFEQILQDYPKRSHADDALMYLGRIARKRHNKARERALLDRALSAYPGGDMVHEFVWEHLESLFRVGDYESFIGRLETLELPARDDEYFSQGRLGYFQGRAHVKLGDDEAARTAWRDVWRRYPFSFYGYLSHVALDEAGVRPPDLATDAARRPPGWFFDSNWDGRTIRQLSSLGLFGLAADLQAGRLAARRQAGEPIDDADLWRLGYLHHRAERYPQSHNVPRRLIGGRPWVDPETGRLLRWRIAFPTPYLQKVAATTRRYRDRQARVPPELPLSIMREESAFVADIESWAGALGLMQLMPMTARGHAEVVDGEVTSQRLREADINIRIGVDHLYYLAERFESHPAVMVAAYNAGGGAVSSWLPEAGEEPIGLWVEDIPYRQTRHYTKRVIGTYAAYQWLAGTHDLSPAPAQPPPTD